MDKSRDKYTGINHLAFVTGDMDMTVRFWRDLLGLRLSVGFGEPGYRQYFFRITDTEYITFFEWDGAEPVEEKEHGVPFKGAIAFDHVSLGMISDDALWEMKEKLDAADIWVSEVIDHGFIQSIYAFDPNGIPIEFSVFVDAVDIEADPLMADKHPVQSAKEGTEPQEGVWPLGKAAPPKNERKVYPGLGSGLFKKK